MDKAQDGDVLLIKVSEGVATLTLNRPEALNALSRRLRRALVAALTALDARDDVKVMVLTGTGRAFCPGIDLREGPATAEDPAPEGPGIGEVMAGLETPIIGAINGLAVTGGFEIALACDMLIAGQSAWFQDGHVKIGYLPAMGLSVRLARLVGPARAKEISLTARRIPSDEAARLGLVTRVVADEDLGAAAQALARDVAQWAPDVLRAMKGLIDAGLGHPLPEALGQERQRAAAWNARPR
ncbi:enoyl-CoA hydratase-related protein [Mesobacterium pallidum]|uniref:enoyl-CoA hydratase-related protein n=1 Tax=Mesobacterium pallidum TaxID=2872037 RepID=UPI001EE18EED|nr:enoyl-CoA hydratase-related protein [Mesobacterium pallidum]